MAEQSDGLSLHLERFLPAPPPVVFAAVTEPRALAEWWGPSGFTTPGIELDLRVGGAYRIAMKPPEGSTFHVAGRFRVIDTPRLLAYTFAWEPADPDDRENAVTLRLLDAAGGTRLVVDQGPFATDGRRDLHVRGWTESLDRLHDMLSAGAGPRGDAGVPV